MNPASSTWVRHQNALMVAAGVVIGLLAAFVLLAIAPAHWPNTTDRTEGLRQSLAVFEHGGPLLLGRHGTTGSFFPIGTDEEGTFVYFPLLSRLFELEPLVVQRYVYIALFALTAAIYPLVFYKLTRSPLAGIAAPIALLVCVRSLGFDDIYWVPAWGALTFLPLLYLLDRDWGKFGILALTGIAFAAGWVSSVRANSGLAIVVPAVIVLLLRRWSLWRLLPGLALLFVAYISINTFIFTAIRDHRNHQIGAAAARVVKAEEPSPHIWHTMYIGLGYLPNNYRVHYADSVASAQVQADAPGTPFLSARYDKVIRSAYFSVLSHHPLEVVKQYAAKILATVAETAPYLLLVLITMPAMLMGAESRARQRWILLTIPAFAFACLPTLIAIPVEAYEQGLYGVVGALGIVGVGCMLREAELEARRRGRLTSLLTGLPTPWSTPRDTDRNPNRRFARIWSMALLALILLVAAGYFVNRSAERWQGYSSAVLIASTHNTVVTDDHVAEVDIPAEHHG
jgi:hypothetical protein